MAIAGIPEVINDFNLYLSGGKLGGIRVMPPDTGYLFTWLSCAVTAVAMAVTLALGLTAAYYLLFALVAWLFVQAVFFTVKLM